MKIIIEQLPRGLGARTAIRRCGYGAHMSREVSYWKRLGTGTYPRFHVYLEERGSGKVCFNLHLDQKEVSYEGNHAHSGEYEGDVVEREAERIRRVIAMQEDD
ncbi:MAG: hypothetical protein HY981_03235 [Candidatus Magasanikbacteria bacterium]|nr:hypothetical protein [Candidatus Magasanikbacteria bacterium]